MVIFSKGQWRIFNKIRRRYKVSLEFLKYNLPNILKFIAYYTRRLHFVLIRSAERSERRSTVIIKYNSLKRSLFDETYCKKMKNRKRNIKQWSKRMVYYLRKTQGVKEFITIAKINSSPQKPIQSEEVTKQLKEQLELLKSGKRSTNLIDFSISNNECESKSENGSLQESISFVEVPENGESDTGHGEKNEELILNEKTGVLERDVSVNLSGPNTLDANNVPKEIESTSADQNGKNNPNILDLLMSKVRATSVVEVKNSSELASNNNLNDPGVDSGEEFLGFAEDEKIPGLMKTPLVPPVSRSKQENSAFISESLDEYFRENSLNRNSEVGQTAVLLPSRKLRRASIDGLMTNNCTPPDFSMPAVPESLHKLRTVAERRNYFQRFSKNFKMAIINNEAAIYRELQRKIRQPKIKLLSQQAMQADDSQMSFTRQGWQAASFITTDINKYYFQKIFFTDENETAILPGVRGNNTDQYKKEYSSKVSLNNLKKCPSSCIDCYLFKCFKPISPPTIKTKICKEPCQSIFKPCPLSEKARQPLPDDDAAEITLIGGGMSVVCLPTVELQVCPELGKPFNDIAKRYLEHIMPYEKITREWAEFSTATIQTPFKLLMDSNRELKTFTFPVPYANDRKHLLVRRVVDRTEKLDTYFLQSSEETNLSGLTFCEGIDRNDKTQVECASLLADMINAVAISCCESSFAEEDDTTFGDAQNKSALVPSENLKTIVNSSPSQKHTLNSKKSRLICELRRLNATIIETNAPSKDDEQRCSRDFCALGCICSSLRNGYPLQQHCGNPKCMLECNCKGSPPSNIIRVETEGHSITTEDAYNMRRQATARLARIEKEFTSTVVVTENETLLINETQYDKKRRCTKLPKRYQDYRDTDNDFDSVSPVKSCSTPLIDANDSRVSPITIVSEVMSDLPDPIHIKQNILQQLKHCSIPLVPFKEIQNMAVWCMVHHLYKCFCGGQDLQGKPMIIEREDSKTGSLENVSSLKKVLSSKPFYSFESSDEKTSPGSKRRHNSEEFESEEIESEPSVKDYKTIKKKPKKPYLKSEMSKEFFKEQEKVGCSRFVRVPSQTYRSINQKRRCKILNAIESTEDMASQFLLNEHIMRSVYFHKENKKATLKQKVPEPKKEPEVEVIDPEPTLKPLEIENKVEEKIIKPAKMEFLELPLSKPINVVPIMIKRNLNLEKDSQPVIKKPKMSEAIEVIEEKPEEGAVKMQTEEIKVPKISGCYSLKSHTVVDINEKTNNMKYFIDTQFTATEKSTLSPSSENIRENYNDVIKMLNSLVSRKMHDIDNALKRDSKIVPPPSENILCVLQWKNFLGAFDEGLIHVWKIKMKTRYFLAATITSMIPMVPGALGIMNITQTPLERLPLIGRMLLKRTLANISITLAVIMQGRSHYWYIKGFLKPNVTNACLKPTPETHPELTQKINTLCSSLIKQRSKEADRRDSLLKQKPKTIDLKIPIQTDPLANIPAFIESTPPALEKISNCFKQTEPTPSRTIQTPTTKIPDLKEVTKTKDTSAAIATIKFNQYLRTSNIEIREATPSDILDIQTPEACETDHSWYVLDLCNDFSHIYVSLQSEIVSLDRIKRLVTLSVEKQKVIRIQFMKSESFNAFILPSSKSKILFGPFALDVEPPILILLQSVDGKMMTREVYQSIYKIPPRPKKTTAFWLRQINGKISFDAAKETWEAQVNVVAENEESNSQISAEDDCDNDCMIVEEFSHLSKKTTISREPTSLVSLPQAKLGDNGSLQIATSPMNLKSDVFVEIGPLGSKAPGGKLSSSADKRTTFLIQPSNDSKKIEVLASSHDIRNNRPDTMQQRSQQYVPTSIVHLKPLTGLVSKPTADVTAVKKIQRVVPLTPTLPKPNTTIVNSIPTTSTNKANTIIPIMKRGIPVTSFSKPKKPRMDMESSFTTSVKSDDGDHYTVIAVKRIPPKVTSTNGKQQTVDGSSDSSKILNETPFMTGIYVPSKAPVAANNSMVTMTSNSNKPCVLTTNTTVTPKVKCNTIIRKNVPPLQRVTTPTTKVIERSTISIAQSKVMQRTSGNPMKTPESIIMNEKSVRERSTISIAQSKVMQRISGNPMKTPESMIMNEKSVSLIRTEVVTRKAPTPVILNAVGSGTQHKTVEKVQIGIQKQISRGITSTAIKSSQINTYRLASAQAPTTDASTTQVQQRVWQASKNNNIIASNGVPLNRILYNIQTGGGTSPGVRNPNPTSTTSSSSVGVSLPSTNQSKRNLTPVHSKLKAVAGGPSKTFFIENQSVYGHFSTSLPELPRFTAKRIDSGFLINIPDIGVFKADEMKKVNAFLSHHVSRIYPNITQKLLWTFWPSPNNNSIKNNLNNLQMEEKKPTPPGSSSTTKPTLSNLMKSALQAQKNPDETILVND